MRLILSAILCLGALTTMSTADEKKADHECALDFKMKDIDGKKVDLEDYEGDVVLIVNTASKCWLTPQYAGLEELLEIEPDYIKIDRTMVSGVDQDPARQDVLTALLQLADKMGAQVIGEGLDTLEELEMLGRLGIRFGQGWLFGRPTPLRATE